MLASLALASLAMDEDEALVAGLRAGDEGAFVELVQRYQPRLLRVAEVTVGSHAVAQEVTQLLSHALESPGRLSILELQGLGKEHWEHTDAAAHVERERATWD